MRRGRSTFVSVDWCSVLFRLARTDSFSILFSISDGQNMTGTMPTELTLLPFLQSLSLSWNLFTGTIPAEFGQTKHLLQFEVHWNHFTGTIPQTVFDRSSLIHLNIGGNAISGSLAPDQITGLSEIKGFFVDENLLDGTFPTEIGQLSLLSKCIRFLLHCNRCSFHSLTRLSLTYSTFVSYSLCSVSKELLHRELAI